MAGVIERLGHSIDDRGVIHYDEIPSTFEAADAIAGARVDRRRNYCIMDGKLHESTTWTDTCSGCTDGGEYWEGPGMGCRECGYHGVVRNSMWIEYETAQACRADDADARRRAPRSTDTVSIA